ncbi:MAG: sulfatase-like hydrolase/transferase [Lentisphaerae bacterium]|nr:sulfatase-like hydrolase/transferase [Lentisphaerota bacterium]MBT4814489.1 sulfatase-like hydrolase/transferase [Lentisphaerota bacterium]MBT5605226.1 sulfatase-like hydrolase/transferase [Lentisphaerota bacterium]MBT7054322.1 sulfatase-like hydrolase/transferase [Lentisphaerota bacterium]MBT7844894.1 sulfatase-like hydrolase/transferase [Lentisphaerota bacterium]
MSTNIVFIVTDNQSPWTLGCYGNREILTPHVDRLAADGTRFTNAFCTNPVCSPNRATLMTGLMPSQHGVHSWLGREDPNAQMGPGAYCTIAEFANLPQICADAGFDCGMSGKWHLGDSLKPQLGFGYWFAKPQGHTSSFHDADAIWQGQVYKEPRYYLEAITQHALDFIEQPREGPFFLYVGYNGPYGLDHDMRTGHRNRHTAHYANKDLACFPREGTHPWLKQNQDCIGNLTAMRSYACAVSGVDDGVGAILDCLRRNELERDTLVVFTADHGLCAGHHGMWGMGDHSRPLHVFQENLRVPLIFRHPARIPAGRAIGTVTNHYDFFPSMMDYLGLGEGKLQSLPLPGRSYAGSLLGQVVDWGEEITFHEYENVRSVQTPQWKLVQRHPSGPHELYDLVSDPGESHNLVEEMGQAEIRAELIARLRSFFTEHADPEYDLWQNGRSKAGGIFENR